MLNVPLNFCALPPRIGCAAPTEAALRSKKAAVGLPFSIWVMEMVASVAVSVVAVCAPFSVAVIGVPAVWPNERMTAAWAGAWKNQAPSHNRGNAQCVFHDVKPLCVCCSICAASVRVVARGGEMSRTKLGSSTT